MLVGGGSDGRGATRLDVLQVAGVAEKVAVQRVAAVTLLIVQLHLTFLDDKKEEAHPLRGYMSLNGRSQEDCFDFRPVVAKFTKLKDWAAIITSEV